MKCQKRNTAVLRAEVFRNNRIRFTIAMFFSVACDAATLLISQAIKDILDSITGDTGMAGLRGAVIETAVILGALVILMLGYAFSKNRFQEAAMRNYKRKVFEILANKGIASFKGENSATYISAITNDATAIESGYVTGIFNIVTQIVNFVGALALMLYNSPLLTAIAVLMSLLPITASVLTGNRQVKYEKKVSEHNAGFMATVQDALKGFSVIKCFKAEREITGLVEDANEMLEESKRKRNIVKSIIGSIGSLAGAATQFGLFLVGAYMALIGKGITAGTLLLFINVMNNMLDPIGVLPGYLADRKAAIALIEKAAAFAENSAEDEKEEEDIDRSESTSVSRESEVHGSVTENRAEQRAELQHEICVKDVVFGYDEEKKVLKGVSATFEKGKSYAIVGASGCGKSTLLNLLMAGYTDYSGSITYDGRELSDIPTRELYDIVSLIEQNVFVFNASVRDNITMFKDFPKEEIDRAIELSGLKKLIAEKGEDYLCGENGSNLSGGERQRISIARSLLRNNSVLLIDEATAALDAETSYYVTNAILDLDGLTRIVITHDLDAATLRRYDGIIALKEGRAAETGTFDELMDLKKYFYSLYTISQ